MLDRAQEATSVGSVHDAVIVRQRQHHHAANRDAVATVFVGQHCCSLDHRAGTEDGNLWLVDDRRIEQGAAAARVRQRERATA